MPHFTSPAGHTLAYDDRGAGTPLVLLHAFPLDRRMWEPQAELADHVRLLTPDLFGFGESSLPAGGWTVDSMADALAEWLTAVGVEMALVGGLSMGGTVSLAFARRHPQRVRGLILADTRSDPDPPEVKANRDKSIALVRESGPAAVVEQMMPRMLSEFTRRTQPAVEERVRAITGTQTPDGVVAGLVALRDRPDSTPALAGFRFPVLVIVGEQDVITPPALSDAMADHLTDVTRETLWGAGHLANLEAAPAFTAAVRRWAAAVG